MNDGIGGWIRQIFATDGRCYFGGRTFDNWLEVAGGLIEVNEGVGLVVVPTESGKDIIQQYYRGATQPEDPGKRVFSTGFIADSEDDYFHYRRVKGRNEAISFFPGVPPQVDLFAATNGETYMLSRLPALGSVPGVTEDDFPILIYLEGELDPSAADITGRTVTANATGELEVEYMPVYTVIISSLSERAEDSGTHVISMTLSEVRTS